MVQALLLSSVLAIFGLPKPQPGEQHPKVPETTNRLSRQIAEAPVLKVGPEELVLERPGKNIHVRVRPGTPVRIRGHAGQLSDIVPGDRVRVSYDAMGGPPQANWIEVLPAPPER